MVKVDPATIAFYQSATHGEWGVGIDAVSALDCWGFDMPGFDGLKLDAGRGPAHELHAGRLCQRRLVHLPFPGRQRLHRPPAGARTWSPGVVPGTDCRDVVTARADYAGLDRPAHPVRIRLSSICVRARNIGGGANPSGVEIAYVRGGRGLPVAGARPASWPAGT